MPTTVTKTVKPGGGGDYSSLESWESSEQSNLNTADEIHICECYSGGNLLGTPGTAFRMTGWITNATNHIVIKAAEGHAHEGAPDTSKAYALCTANSGTADTTLTRAFWISEDTKIQNLQFKSTARNSSNGVLFIQAISNLSEVDGCIIENDRPSAYTSTAVGVRIQNPIATKFRNNIIIMRPNSSSSNVYALDGNQYGGNAAPTHEIYNNTIVFAEQCSRATALRTQWPALDSENNYFYIDGTTSETIYDTALSGAITQGSNDKTDSDAAYSTATFASVTNGSEDFTLVTGSNLVDAGTTLSSVTTDAVGTSRPAGTSYDVGAMELSTSTNYNVSAMNITGQGLFKAPTVKQGGSNNESVPISMQIEHEENHWSEGYSLASSGFVYHGPNFAADIVNMTQTGVNSVAGIFDIYVTLNKPPKIMPQYDSENAAKYLNMSTTSFYTSSGTSAGSSVSAITDAFDLTDTTISNIVRTGNGSYIKTSAASSNIQFADDLSYTTSESATIFVYIKESPDTNDEQIVLAGQQDSTANFPTVWYADDSGSTLETSSGDTHTMSNTLPIDNQIRVLKIDGTSVTEYVTGGQKNTITRDDTLYFNSIFRATTQRDTFESEINSSFAEVIIFNEALSDDDREAVEAGLAQKYGVNTTFPVGHPAKDHASGMYYDASPITNAIASVGFLTIFNKSFGLVDPDNTSLSKLNISNEMIYITMANCRKSPGVLSIEVDMQFGHVS